MNNHEEAVYNYLLQHLGAPADAACEILTFEHDSGEPVSSTAVIRIATGMSLSFNLANPEEIGAFGEDYDVELLKGPLTIDYDETPSGSPESMRDFLDQVTDDLGYDDYCYTDECVAAANRWLAGVKLPTTTIGVWLY